MTNQAYTVALPSSTLTITTQLHACKETTFPDMKIRVIPHAVVPKQLAPRDPKVKGLGEHFAVTVPLAGKVKITWTIDTSNLENIEPLSFDEETALTRRVGATILSESRKTLGIDDFRWQEQTAVAGPSSGLVVTPVAARPASSPLVNNTLQKGEPTLTLRAIKIQLSWAINKGKGKRTTHGTSGELLNPLIIATQVQQQQNSKSDTHNVDYDHIPLDSVLELALEQIRTGMKDVMRIEMIRRFPLIFDGAFIDYQSSLALPRTLLTATNRFLSISAHHRTSFHASCRRHLEGIDAEETNDLKAQVELMARLPAKAICRRKRTKTDESVTPSQSAVQDEQSEREQRISTYLEEVRANDQDATAAAKHMRALDYGTSLIGFTRWSQARIGRGKYSALKIELHDASAHEEEAECEGAGSRSQESLADGPSQSPVMHSLMLEFEGDQAVPELSWSSMRDIEVEEGSEDGHDYDEDWDDELDYRHEVDDELDYHCEVDDDLSDDQECLKDYDGGHSQRLPRLDGVMTRTRPEDQVYRESDLSYSEALDWTSDYSEDLDSSEESLADDIDLDTRDPLVATWPSSSPCAWPDCLGEDDVDDDVPVMYGLAEQVQVQSSLGAQATDDEDDDLDGEHYIPAIDDLESETDNMDDSSSDDLDDIETEAVGTPETPDAPRFSADINVLQDCDLPHNGSYLDDLSSDHDDDVVLPHITSFPQRSLYNYLPATSKPDS